MAQVTQLQSYSLPGMVLVFSPKTEAAPPTADALFGTTAMAAYLYGTTGHSEFLEGVAAGEAFLDGTVNIDND